MKQHQTMHFTDKHEKGTNQIAPSDATAPDEPQNIEEIASTSTLLGIL